MFKYNKGLFKDDLGNYLHVTTGVGCMDTPMRWGTDSELVILKLRKNQGFIMSQSKFCMNCGNKLEMSDKFCPNCGFKVGKSEEFKVIHDKDFFLKYKLKIENLNKEWELNCWSQKYDSFNDIPSPRGTWHNPNLCFEWYCFHNESHIDFLKMQADILRK